MNAHNEASANVKSARMFPDVAQKDVFAYLARRRPKDARKYLLCAAAAGADVEGLLSFAEENGADVSSLRAELSIQSERGNAETAEKEPPCEGDCDGGDPRLKIRPAPSKNYTAPRLNFIQPPSKNLTQELNKGNKEEREREKREKELTPSLTAESSESALSHSFFCESERNDSEEGTEYPFPATKPPRESILAENVIKYPDREGKGLKNEKTEGAKDSDAELGGGESFVLSRAVKGIDGKNLQLKAEGSAEKIIADAQFPEPFALRKLLWGKCVAVVGNATEAHDRSAEIDAADVVIRFNHFYNYDSGRVGKKIDALFITPSGAWLSLKDDEARRKSIIQRERPIVAFTRFKERCQWATFQRVFAGIPYFYDKFTNASNNQFTTGVSVLELIAQSCENCEIKIFGFGDTDEKMWEYFEREGRHYLPNGFREAIARERLLQILPQFRIYTRKKIEEVFPWEAGTDYKGTPILTPENKETK